MKTRRYSGKVGGVGAGLARQAAQFTIVSDAHGNLSRVRTYGEAPKGLLSRLLARSGVVAGPAPVHPPSEMARVVAKAWDEATDGAGVVLDAAGRGVKP